MRLEEGYYCAFVVFEMEKSGCWLIRSDWVSGWGIMVILYDIAQ